MKRRTTDVIEAISDFIGSTYVSALLLLAIACLNISGLFFGFSKEWADTVRLISALASMYMLVIVRNDSARSTETIQAKLDAIMDALDTGQDLKGIDDAPYEHSSKKKRSME